MRISKRGGLLLQICVAAFLLLLQACQSSKPEQPMSSESSEKESSEESLEVAEVEEAETTVPSELELKELEESVAPDLRSATFRRGLQAQATRHGFELHRKTESDQWVLEKGSWTLLLKKESRIAELNGVTVFLDQPLERVKGAWTLGESDEQNLLASSYLQDKVSGRSLGLIVIDPGHGGTEVGAKNESMNLLEKELNLDVSLRLKEHLEKKGFKTLLTRYDDRKVELDKRSEMANSAKADLFVSVHFNAAGNKKASGLETYVLTPAGAPSTSSSEAGDDAISYPGNRFDAENFELAYRIQRSILDGLSRQDRGVKKARFRVLKGLACPGVLVECGFVSNREESLLLSTPGYRERLSLALANAISGYATSDR